jgi:hypothetical protein|tara:strand:- start:263 stop:973 length:711 start_codon:yes stop_codon:yes gene_type:complete
MALPKLDTPTYTLELPSTGEEIKYRPFLVKEQKTLLILQESEDKRDIINGLQKIVTDCTFDKLNMSKMPIFDFEYLFLKIRCKSVGETAELNLTCPDDNVTTVPVTINLDEIDVQVTEEHTDTIKITDNINMVLRWPTIHDVGDVEVTTDNLVDNVLALLKKCITQINEGDTIHNRTDMSSEELDEFIDSLPSDTFEDVGKYFETMPQLLHVVNITNPKTKVDNEIVIQGLESFFE